jgi:hypothetical protein
MKREALPRDGTLWMASHRDSTAILAYEITVCQILEAENWIDRQPLN